jgi:serine/threonine protein kinase
MKPPTLLGVRSGSSAGSLATHSADGGWEDYCCATTTDGGCSRPRDALDGDVLCPTNASISHASLISSGSLPPARPLEFPAPILDRAIAVPALRVVDHTTGTIFVAGSVLMRVPAHVKSCPCHHRHRHRHQGGGTGNNGGASVHRGHGRAITPDVVHTDALGSSSSSSSSPFPPSSSRKKTGREVAKVHRHRRESSADSTSSSNHRIAPSQNDQRRPSSPRCASPAACNLPDRAYCVRRKMCDTAHGSVRLCVVLRRASGGAIPNCAAAHLVGDDDENENDAALPEWETTSELVVIKVTSWSNLNALQGRHLEDPVREVAALQLLGGGKAGARHRNRHHPHVISISDALQNDTHLFCVLPYASGGGLRHRLIETREVSGRVAEHVARGYFRQILSGICHFQRKGICHRDLCIDNMVLDENGDVRIIDLGLSLRVPYADPNGGCRSSSDVSSNTRRRMITAQGVSGEWHHMAPEVRAGGTKYFDGFAIDLWSAGIALFEILVGERPFEFPDPADVNFRSICVEGDLANNVRSRVGWELSDMAVDLLRSMLRHDPMDRLTLWEIVNHPWVEGIGKVMPPSSSSSREGDEPHRWLIKTESIDDLDLNNSVVPARLSLSVLRDSYHRESTFGTVTSSEVMMEVDDEDEVFAMQPHDESSACNLPRRPRSIDDDYDGGEKDKKCSWGCIFPSKKIKWPRRPVKVSASLPLQSSTGEFS